MTRQRRPRRPPGARLAGWAGPLAALVLALAGYAQPGSTIPIVAPSVVIGAGDIGTCGGEADEATARLLDGMPGTVLTLGDTTDGDGSAAEIAGCYGPTWGRHLARTRPSPGNHDYETPGAGGYFGYFGAAAGDPAQGWYSYDLGGWHVVVLNSNCAAVSGCGVDSTQGRWLADDLDAASARCTLAYWHHPRFTAGQDGDTLRMAALWAMLHAAGAEVVLSGHTHAYERYAPLDAAGEPDSARGIRQIVAGTGGNTLHPIHEPRAHAEVWDDETHGVVRLELHDGWYAWGFVPVPGEAFTDAGTGACH